MKRRMDGLVGKPRDAFLPDAALGILPQAEPRDDEIVMRCDQSLVIEIPDAIEAE